MSILRWYFRYSGSRDTGVKEHSFSYDKGVYASLVDRAIDVELSKMDIISTKK